MAALKAPAGMTKEAKAHFDRLVKEAGHRLELYHVDSLVLYCETWVDVSRIRAEFRKEKELVHGGNNKQQQITPLWTALKEGSKLLRELAMELGVSPVSEAKAKLEKPEEAEGEDKYSKFRTPRGF